MQTRAGLYLKAGRSIANLSSSDAESTDDVSTEDDTVTPIAQDPSSQHSAIEEAEAA